MLVTVALHGGGAAKVSGWYEEAWILYSMLDLLAGLASSMTLEPPGTAGYGFEFSLLRASGQEWHQVKYQNGRYGKWTLPELDKEDVLQRFRDKLKAEPRSLCCFVSAHAAFPLSKLCDHAMKARHLQAFEDTYLSSADLRTAFESLRDKYWKLSSEETWAWLHGRVRVRTIDKELLESVLHERARTFLSSEDSRESVAVLREVMQAALYDELDRTRMEAELAQRACPPRAWATGPGSIVELVAQSADDFARKMGASLIHRSFIERDVLHELRRLAERGTPPAAILVTGRRGSGKSAIIGELIQTLARDPSWRILAMDAAALSHEANTLAVGNRFGLPVPPGSALAAASIGARGLFVLDALDAVSLSRDKPPELFPVLNAVINEVRAYPNVTLLASCRSEDLASDERLRVLAYGSEPAEVVEVTELPTAQLVDLIEQLGVDIKSLSENQLRLLSTPELLKCFIESVEAGPPDFDTAEELRGRYVDFKTRGS